MSIPLPRRAVALLAACALGGCTALNPDFDAGLDDGVVGSVGPGHDAGPRPRDFAVPPVACSGARGCLSSSLAGVCKEGTLQTDRTCPMGSSCDGGHCQSPPLAPGTPVGMPCVSEEQCYYSPQTSGYSCQPFVNRSGMVEMRCADRLGDGGSGATCATNADCRSGFCLDNKECFRLCTTDSDCPKHGNTHLVCRQFTLHVEGATTSVLSCTTP
jgi:hypothetical protein